jgi:hypothetical protein
MYIHIYMHRFGCFLFYCEAASLATISQTTPYSSDIMGQWLARLNPLWNHSAAHYGEAGAGPSASLNNLFVFYCAVDRHLARASVTRTAKSTNHLVLSCCTCCAYEMTPSVFPRRPQDAHVEKHRVPCNSCHHVILRSVSRLKAHAAWATPVQGAQHGFLEHATQTWLDMPNYSTEFGHRTFCHSYHKVVAESGPADARRLNYIRSSMLCL